MSYINLDLANTQEAQPVPNGAYELQITGAEATQTGENSKHPGAPMIKVSLGFTDLELNAPNIVHFIVFPYGPDDENAGFKTLNLKRFLVAFSVPFGDDGVDVDDLAFSMIGQSATVEVTQTEPDDEGNIYNRIRLPRLSNNAKGGSTKPPKRSR